MSIVYAYCWSALNPVKKTVGVGVGVAGGVPVGVLVTVGVDVLVGVTVGVTPTKALPFADTVNAVPALGFLALSRLLNKPVNDVG